MDCRVKPGNDTFCNSDHNGSPISQTLYFSFGILGSISLESAHFSAALRIC